MWQDTTIRVESEGQVEIAPDGDVHVTWMERGVSLTVIVSQFEARRLSALLGEQLPVDPSAAVAEAERIAAARAHMNEPAQ